MAQFFRVDFSEWTGPPLVKGKFDVYQTPLIQGWRLQKYCTFLEEIGVQNLRYEMGWGKRIELNYPQISGTSDSLIYNFSDLDIFIDSLKSQRTKPMFAVGYAPWPIQTGGKWENMVSDLDAWKKINRDYAYHIRVNKDLKSPFYEIWNEPDFDMFFLGNLEDYLNLYKYGVKGIREGDPEAMVGGPALAFPWNRHWMRTLLEFTNDNQLPLDFLSAHSYAHGIQVTNDLRWAVEHFPNPRLPLMLTEYGSYPTDGSVNIGTGGPQERHINAMWFFRDVHTFLNYPDLTNVFFAQWIDVEVVDHLGNWRPGRDKLGLLSLEGNRKAIFNAFKIYSWIPADRRQAIPASSNGVFVMAGTDPFSAGVAIWNTHESERSIAIQLQNLPIRTGRLETYRIDSEHSSWRDSYWAENLEIIEDESFVLDDHNHTWSGKIPGHGVIYLHAHDLTGRSYLEKQHIGEFVRHHYWFPDRSKEAYALFDKETSIARLGMGSSDQAQAITAAEYFDLAETLYIRVRNNDHLRRINDESMLGLRFDFITDEGFVKSVMYHNGFNEPVSGGTFPWGTETKPDKTIEIKQINSGEDFIIHLSEVAPAGWKGHAIVSFHNQSCVS